MKKPYMLTLRVDEKLYRDTLRTYESIESRLAEKTISHMIRTALRRFISANKW